MQRYNPKGIEPRWQRIWDETGVYTADLKSDKPKYIAMSMLNYPSGAGIHIGHAMNYTISDVKARFKRQQGYESYHPIGWDAFGLPAENYAIKAGVSPQESMATIIPNYHKQYKAMGWSNDWEKEISTHLPEYYKWTQWIFSQMYKHGLAYQDSRMQWWCEQCQTVLANEQVIDGKCWRHDGPNDPLVQKKEVKQWFFKITDYADELLEATDNLDWTNSVKLAQKNWIGRKTGIDITYAINEEANYVLLHGYTGSPQGTFFPWLTKRIQDSGKTVVVPVLPNSDNPQVNEQVEHTLKNCEFNENTVLLGQSFGATVALKVVENLETPIKRLVLVVGFAEPGFLDHERPFEKTFDWQFDFKKIKQNAREIIVLRDTKDEIVPPERADYLATQFNAQIIDFEAQGNHASGKKEPVVLEHTLQTITVFTTRPDTNFGATFVVLAPEHSFVQKIIEEKIEPTDGHFDREAVASYVQKAISKSEVERQEEGRKKTGVFTGFYAKNELTGRTMPVWVSDFVLAGFGTGAVVGVPGHDLRDFQFAKEFDLPILRVVVGPDGDTSEISRPEQVQEEAGTMINSDFLNGLTIHAATEKIMDYFVEKGWGRRVVNYKMRDWSVSRQRYWGAPIPIIHCAKCGSVLVPDKDLPVILPELDDFQPSGDGRSALARAKDWLRVECPQCGGPAERETDTLDTYICSSWYMYRYLDPHNQQQIFDSDIINKWAPIDFYNGADHATAHLLYARFVVRFFSKIGLVDNPEPFKQMLFNGKVTAADGRMFSKSKGNGIDPLEIIEQGYGADALRTYLMFAAPLEIATKWDPQGVPGTHRFLQRVWNLVMEYLAAEPVVELGTGLERDLQHAAHQMIKKVTQDIEHSHYNTAIAAAMACTNQLYKLKVLSVSSSPGSSVNTSFGQHVVWQQALESLVACIAPFAPHTSEELWHQLGHSTTVHKDSWPLHDEKYLVQDTITVVVQVNGKLRGEVQVASDPVEAVVIAAAKAHEKVASYLTNQTIRKTIYVPGKLVNFVV